MAVRYAPAVHQRDSFRVGDWLVEPSLNQLTRGDLTIQLEFKVMEVLVCLAERAGEIVTRQEIIDRVWAVECIADNTLTKAVTEIRNALGDDARHPSHIETIHRRGYRLIAQVDDADHHDAVGSMVGRYAFLGSPERARVERGPYPGLAVFSEEESDSFFGREEETAGLWRKLRARRMLALIGPSGVGKSSLIRAGVVAARPEGWSAVVCQPGREPFVALARALVSQFDGDKDAIARLIHVLDVGEMVAILSRWRDRHDHVLLAIDQFEELFTLCNEETQVRFAQLLRRLADVADVHILLALRDDFLCRCHSHATLRPIFADLTVLDQPGPVELRRAIVEPAKRTGYAFIDTDLPNEMVEEVDGERGALPLLAFASARMWEKRDRGRKLLTRDAYEEIGGVCGALARHADNTLTAIGEKRLPMVREVFRNLVSASGTRTVREFGELLSVFPETEREDARAVVEALIDARLLTAFEDNAINGNERLRRVELVHESLLTSWPRLVRWQAQDVDAAELRDQLRDAAVRWDDRGRTSDFLWAGRMYREFVVWRENYPGGLSEVEQAFETAMDAWVNRKKYRVRLLGVATLVVAATLATVFGTLWRRSIHETKRADAQKLLALGTIEMQTDPTAALAWGRASLATSDTLEGRHFALEALAKGPIARYLKLAPGDGVVHRVAFDPKDEWLVLPGWEQLKLCRGSGEFTAKVDDFPTDGWSAIWPFVNASGDRVAAFKSGEIRTFAVPGLSEVARNHFGEAGLVPVQTDRGLMVFSRVGDGDEITAWDFGDGKQWLAKLPLLAAGDFDGSGDWIYYVPVHEDRTVYRRSMIDPKRPPQVIHRHDEPVSDLFLHPQVDWMALRGRDSETMTVWSLVAEEPELMRSFDVTGLPRVAVDSGGSRIVAAGRHNGTVMARVFDLGHPADVEPVVLRSRLDVVRMTAVTTDPKDRWLVAGMGNIAAFWPLDENPDLVFAGNGAPIHRIQFTHDGGALAIRSVGSNGLRLQPLEDDPGRARVHGDINLGDFALDPLGRLAVFSEVFSHLVWVYPFDGSEPIRLEGFDPEAIVWPVAYNSDLHRVAAGVFRGPRDQKTIREWNLDDGSYRTYGPVDCAGDGSVGGFSTLSFLPDGGLLSSGESGVRRWRPDDGSSQELMAGSCWVKALAPNGRYAVIVCGPDGSGRDLSSLDLDTGEVTTLKDFRGTAESAAFSPAGDQVAVGMRDGTVHMRRIAGGEVHILYGHDSPVESLDFSPDGSLIASADRTGMIRVRQKPDLSAHPLHTLSHDELMAQLDTFTNLRAVRDRDSSTGWKLEIGEFPGWAAPPEP